MWERAKLFLSKAGTTIFGMVLVVWFLGNIPLGVEYASEQSMIGSIGKVISPVLKPLGFGTWQAAVALTMGFVAKEVVVSTFGALYGTSIDGLGAVISMHFTPLSAYSFMVFTLLYVPCVATLAAIRRETNSIKWMLFAAAYMTAVAWIMSFLVFQIGSILGFS